MLGKLGKFEGFGVQESQVSFYAFGIATLLFTAFGLAGFARFGDEVLWPRKRCRKASKGRAVQ